MKGVLFRLFLRVNLIWELLVVSILARIISFLCEGLEVLWIDKAETGARVYESGPALLLHLALLSGVVVGLLSNVALQDMGYCRTTWTLPGYGKGLRQELKLLAAGSVVLSALGFAVFTRDMGLITPPALTLLGFGLGTLLWDPRIGKGPGLLAGFVVLVLLVFARALIPFAPGGAWLLVPAGLLLSTYAIRRSTSRFALRARALVLPADLGTAFQPPSSVSTYKSASLKRVKGWSRGPIAGARSWMHAVLFEGAGWTRGGWVTRSVSTGLGAAAIMSLLLIGLGVRRGGTLDNGLAWLAQAIFDPPARLEGVIGRPPQDILALAFATTAFLIVLGTRQDLRRGVLYPLSRKGRAVAIWRAGLAQTTVAMGATALGFAFFGVLGLLTSDVVLPYRRVPVLISVMLLCAVLLPALQWFRLRFLESALVPLSPTVHSAGSATVSIAFVMCIALLTAALRQAKPGDAALLTYVSLPALLVFSQYLYYRWITSWFARIDLA